MRHEGLKFARLMMVLSSLTPLYVLWSIRGIRSLPDEVVWSICGCLILVPNLLLVARLKIARKRSDSRVLVVENAEDHRDHLLVYLFAVLLPLFDTNLGDRREGAATLAAFVFVVFIFWHLNLHYMNILFALCGYRVYSIESVRQGSPIPTTSVLVVLTKRSQLRQGERLQTTRISDSVYLETGVPE